MNVITAYKVDETTVRLECDDGILMELYEAFSFYVPGYQFMPSYRNKMWNGKIYQVDRRSRTIPFGLLHRLYKFCAGRGYELKIDRSIINGMNSPCVEEVYNALSWFPLTDEGEEIEPYDYQWTAIRHAIQCNRSLLISPTGSGKSLIIYMMIRWYLQFFGKKVLIIVPTTSLVEQMYSDFLNYAETDNSFDESLMHRIYSGHEKKSEAKITISTWQSIYKLPKSWFSEYEMVVGDEVHLFKAKSLISIMNKLTNAWFRVGTTGTLDGTQVHEHVLEGCFGPKFKVTSTKELIDRDVLSKLSIDVLTLQYKDEEKKAFGKKKYMEEIDYIISHDRRNDFIKNLTLSQKGNSLVLFTRVEQHGVPLYEAISKEAEGRQVFFVSGKTKVDDRERIRRLTEKEHNGIIIASSQVFSTGINIKNLHNVIFASPTKSQIRVLQSIGRSLRKPENGQPAKIYDLCDDLRWKTRRNYTFNHGLERVKIYAREKFEYKTQLIKV